MTGESAPRHSNRNGSLRARAGALLQRWLPAGHTWLYRRTRGRLGGSMFGAPVLLLTTTGRRTGQQRTTPLIYLRDGNTLALVASNGGRPADPAWWLNLQSNPDAEVQVRGRQLPVRAERASAEDKARLWPRFVERYRGYEGYQQRTDRDIPVVVLRARRPDDAKG